MPPPPPLNQACAGEIGAPHRLIESSYASDRTMFETLTTIASVGQSLQEFAAVDDCVGWRCDITGIEPCDVACATATWTTADATHATDIADIAGRANTLTATELALLADAASCADPTADDPLSWQAAARGDPHRPRLDRALRRPPRGGRRSAGQGVGVTPRGQTDAMAPSGHSGADPARFVFGPERTWDDDPRLADGAVSRVVVLGDIHGGTPPLIEALAIAEATGAGAVVQVGDFWLQDATWGRFRSRNAKVVRRAMAAPIPVIALDGNHEVWPCLTAYATRADVHAARSAGRPLHLGGSLWWADRGSTWTWSGARCGALGGAVSPDRWIASVANERWAAAEAPTRADAERLCSNAGGDLDVLFCHDAPAGVGGLRSGLDYRPPVHIEAAADYVRALLRSVVDRTAPRLVFHGHWHDANREHLGGADADVISLDADGWPGSAAVLDLAALTATIVDGDLRSDTHRRRQHPPPAL